MSRCTCHIPGDDPHCPIHHPKFKIGESHHRKPRRLARLGQRIWKYAQMLANKRRRTT